VNRYFLAFRRLIYLHQVSQKEQIVGVVEVDESFLALRGFVDGQALEKESGARLSSRFLASTSATVRFNTELITDYSAKTLQAIIRGKVSSVHSDCWKGYDGLVDVGLRQAFSYQQI